MEQFGPIIFLAFIIIGLIVYSKYQEKSAIESEQRERDAQKQSARKRRESWSPPLELNLVCSQPTQAATCTYRNLTNGS